MERTTNPSVVVPSAAAIAAAITAISSVSSASAASTGAATGAGQGLLQLELFSLLPDRDESEQIDQEAQENKNDEYDCNTHDSIHNSSS